MQEISCRGLWEWPTVSGISAANNGTTPSPYSTGCTVAGSCGPTANTHGFSHCTVTVGQNGKYTAYDGGPTGSIYNSRLQVQSGPGGPPGPNTFYLSDSCSMAGCVPRVRAADQRRQHVVFLPVSKQQLDKPAKLALAKGEHQRDRVLTDDEAEKYLNSCPQPWRDCATIILDEGFRPGEVFCLRWPHILFNHDGTGLIQIVSGKSKAARRVLPMTPRVYELLWSRYESMGQPEDDWVFPTASKCGHFDGNAAKEQHKRALDSSGVDDFVPYVLRHTALTRLGEKAGGDVFVLARIAGHSSITITQRYVHPQADAIQRVFGSQLVVGTKLGTTRELPQLTPSTKTERASA
jgi:site-specific recombinase XerD